MGSVIEINPFTRVEGHGSVKLYLDGTRVERVELCLTESPRLFESLLVGRSYAEIPEIICRICSLCSTIHKVTALLAVEKAFGVEVSQVTSLSRELIATGGLLQSHSLHLYCLLLPDLLGLRGVAELALAAPEQLKGGLAVKRAGNLIQETVGGRLIHPVNVTLGGLGHRVGRDALLQLRDELEAVLPVCREAFRLFSGSPPLPQLHLPYCLALDPAAPPLSGDRFRMTGGGSFPVEAYRDCLTESVLPYSHAKYARILGREPTVGALARLNLGTSLGPGPGGAFETVKEEIVARDIRGNNVAQAVELFQAAERSLALIDQLIAIGRDGAGNVKVAARNGRGTAACEAPRGTLIHSYAFDDAGICTEADVITPTSLNQGALSRDLLELARGMEGGDASQTGNALERLIRCYDPCISCSVHVVKL
ncbi:MAG: hydrogenase [Geobacteraceae bacterium GWC2_58_44]|nr:MAG: hydrogenase [Geobacteraceae bacterium GWC2_58_44]HBG05712.1 hydrogenase [Geobacter sp.]